MHRLKMFLAFAVITAPLLTGCGGGGIPEGPPPKDVGYVPPGPDEAAAPPPAKGASAPK